MFMSQYSHSLDAKGRLIMPSKYRDALGEEFVISKGLDGCLYVYAEKDWTLFEEKLTNLPLTNKDARQFARFFLSGADSVVADKQGRFLIPSNLREFAKLDKDVVFVGAGSRIEIWNKETFEALDIDANIDDISMTMDSLGLTI